MSIHASQHVSTCRAGFKQETSGWYLSRKRSCSPSQGRITRRYYKKIIFPMIRMVVKANSDLSTCTSQRKTTKDESSIHARTNDRTFYRTYQRLSNYAMNLYTMSIYNARAITITGYDI